MRGVRMLVVGVVVFGSTFALPLAARADGGAYIDLDRTHYLPGQTAIGRGYVAIPKNQQDLLERGPFYLFLLPPKAALLEGRPIPGGALRLGSVSIEPQKGTAFELRTTFTVPDVPGDFYSLGVCNDPCTISGFREPLSGLISVVATAREGELLTQNQQLSSKNWILHRRVRKLEKQAAVLEQSLSDSRGSAVELSTQVNGLQRELAAADTAQARPSDARPLVDAWALFGIVAASLVALVAITLGIAASRRPALLANDTIEVPDTIESLEVQEQLTER